MDGKISKKFSPSGRLRNVKGLLSTGILEGVKVFYKKYEEDGNKKLRGIINGTGYQCGCSDCNYTKVLSARDFEKHAGASSNNQNNHVFFKSGISIYALVKDLWNSPLGSLAEVIEEKIGCRANMKQFKDWKGRHELQKSSIIRIKLQKTRPKLENEPHLVRSSSRTIAVNRASRCLSDDRHPEYQSPIKKHELESVTDGMVLKIPSRAEPFSRSEASTPCSPYEKMEGKISKKFSPSSLLCNVKGLLSTGLLEGVKVYYEKYEEDGNKKLRGIINGTGYQCGCSDCNYTKVLSARDFEKHAGASSNNQNNHVFFKSGISIYALVKDLWNSPLGSLAEVIEEKIGCRANMKQFKDWKGRHELQKSSIIRIKLQKTRPKLENEPHLVRSSSRTIAVNSASRCLSDDRHPEYQSPIKKHELESVTDGMVLKIPSRAEPFSRSEASTPCSPYEKMEGKISKKFSPSSLLCNVKGLLSTGLLEGVKVYYEKYEEDGNKKLRGIINGTGYQCGCSDCNYTKVLSARDFEKHAGASSNNQNNHVFFKSGISIYALVKDLWNSPLGSLAEVIEEKIGCRANMKQFKDWKGDIFLLDKGRHELPKASIIRIKDLKTLPKLQNEPHKVRSRTIAVNRASRCLSDDRHPEYQSPIEKHELESVTDGMVLKIPTRAKPFSRAEASTPCSPYEKMDGKISKKFSPSSLLCNVKGLLSTGLLEGVKVLYKKYEEDGKKKLRGIIKGIGYQCSCSDCNDTKVLSARDFEKHAGASSKNQNNHVFFKSGISIYALVKDLRDSPLGSLGEVIEEKIGCRANMKQFKDWKDKCRHELQKSSIIRIKDLKTLPKLQNEPHLVRRSPSGTHLNNLHESTVSPVQPKPTVQGGETNRDNYCHRLIFMENGLIDGSEVAYYLNGKIVLEGFKFANGIVCGCCGNKVSPSQFEAHAGYAATRQVYLHTYTSDGVSLHKKSISLSKRIIRSDDRCTICRKEGDMISCDGCPKVFHTGCLKLQCYPGSKWYCPYCKHILGYGTTSINTPSSSAGPITLPLVRIYRDPMDELGGCVLCKGYSMSLEVFNAKTTMICRQCEKEFHVSCLMDQGCDLKEYHRKWFCCRDCDIIHAALQNLVFHGPEIVPESLLYILKRKNEEEGLTNEPGDDVQWQLLSGTHQSYKLLLSAVTAIFQDAFYPIVDRGDNLLHNMIEGDVKPQNFEGMYCAVLIVRSVIVSVGILRIFGRNIAELPLVATAEESRGKGYFQTLLLLIEGLLGRLKVEVLVTPVADSEEWMWVNKFGFVKMAEDRSLKYATEHPMLMFEKTTVLEKAMTSRNDGKRKRLRLVIKTAAREASQAENIEC